MRQPYLFPIGATIGEHNVVLHATAKRHSVTGFAGPASIKTVRRGRVAWLVSGRELVVDPASFLVLAAGEKYSMRIDAAQPVETCCAFFAPGYLEQLSCDLTSSIEHALEPRSIPCLPLPFLSALHTATGKAVTQRLRTLAERCERTIPDSAIEEEFLLLGTALLTCYGQIEIACARVPAARPATRNELFRRLLIGREYIHAHSTAPLSLAAIASASCLSPFHFHRGFRQAFEETPHEYLTGLRLLQADGLLRTGASVLDACVAVGFSSPSAFSRLFRARLGCLPSTVRRNRFAEIRKIGQASPCHAPA